MKKRLLGLLLSAMLVYACVGCGAKNTTAKSTETATEVTTEESAPEQAEEVFVTTEEIMTPTPEPTEELHAHNYAETITTEATCEMDGLKTFTCECGNSYTKPISATGHIFENYVYNEDATYLADGTETATCTCGLTDTRTIEGSKLKYTYTDMSATMYAQQTVNVRDLPDTSGNKLGALSTNDEIAITGQCNETGWYRFEYNGQIAFASDKYLSCEKIETVEITPVAQPQTTNENLESFPYPLYVWEKQLSDQGFYFYRIYTPYNNYRDVVDLNWNGQTNFNLFENGNYDVIDTLSYNWPPNTGYHTVFWSTKVGEYKEGTIYATDWGRHFVTDLNFPCYDSGTCRPGTLD